MTICIAAIGQYTLKGKRKEAIVFATDHMLTLPQIGQFEHAIEKYRKIGASTVVMLAGEAFLFDKLLKGVKEVDDLTIIEKKITGNFMGILNYRIQKQILDRTWLQLVTLQL